MTPKGYVKSKPKFRQSEGKHKVITGWSHVLCPDGSKRWVRATSGVSPDGFTYSASVTVNGVTIAGRVVQQAEADGYRQPRFFPNADSYNGSFFLFPKELRPAYKRFNKAARTIDRILEANGIDAHNWNTQKLRDMGHAAEVDEYFASGKELDQQRRTLWANKGQE